MKAKLAFLLVGILLGLGVAQLAPRFWHRVTPGVLRGLPTVGTVDSKRWDEERLLLTLITHRGALLASFTRKTEEIDLLVDAGDTVELGLARYRPFVDDPIIDRVVKAGAPTAEGTAPPEAAQAPPPPAGEAAAAEQDPGTAQERPPAETPGVPAEPPAADEDPAAAEPPGG